MNLNDIKSALTTHDREVEFSPEGINTGWYFTLRHESAEEVQKVFKRYKAKVRDAHLKNKKHQLSQITSAHENDLRVAHVAGWRWKDGEGEGRPAFSENELRECLNSKEVGYFLKEFIDTEVGSLEDFLERSETSSPTA